MESIIFLWVLVGLIAQTIDGALGMAYGVTSSTLLISSGLSPAIASASVHTAEVFTTMASGISHLRMGNVDKRLFKKLVYSGAIAAFLGAYVLVNLPLWIIKPIVTVYLGVMGTLILLRAFNIITLLRRLNTSLLAFVGGFMDAIGGGGWGPIVTSTLMAEGNNPQKTIGSVNTAELFITCTQVITFVFTVGLSH